MMTNLNDAPIAQLEIVNFQVHEKFTCDLDPGVTTIVGPSDVGKSSIMRALRWLACNEPSGGDFVRWGAKVACVGVVLDGVDIIRRKGTSVNLYSVGDREFVSFGTTVPPEVASKLRLGAVNFQGQYDRPFWLGDSAGEVSRQLNRVVHLEIIDRTLSKLTSLVRLTIAEEGVLKGRVERAEVELGKWARVPQMEEAFAGLSVLGESRDEESRRIQELGDCIDKGSKLLRDGKRKARCAAEGSVVLEIGGRWGQGVVERTQLRDLVCGLFDLQEIELQPIPDLGNLEHLAREVVDRRATINKLGFVVADLESCVQRVRCRTIPDLEYLERFVRVVEKKHDEIIELIGLVADLGVWNEKVDGLELELGDCVRWVDESLGEVCLLCGQKAQS